MGCCDFAARVYFPVGRFEWKLDRNVPNSVRLTDIELKLGVVVAEHQQQLIL